MEERDDRFPFPAQERFSILLFSPVSWEVNPKESFVWGGTKLYVTCESNMNSRR